MGYQRILAVSLACLDIRGCANSVALVLEMSCTWSLSVQQWQICVAVFQIFSEAHQTMQQFMWQPNLLQILRCRHDKIADGRP